MFRSLRAKLMASFFAFIGLTALLLVLDRMSDSRKVEVAQISTGTENITHVFGAAQLAFSDFLIQDAQRLSFFEDSCNSPIVDRYLLLCDSLFHQTAELRDDAFSRRQQFGALWDSLEIELRAWNGLAVDMYSLIAERGMQDYGVAGEMRKHAHQLETEFSDYISTQDVLTLRRREKDFIHRNDLRYVAMFNDDLERIRRECLRQKDHTQQCAAAIHALSGYQSAFMEYVRITEQLGWVNETGKTTQLIAQGERVEHSIDHLESEYQEFIDQFVAREELLRASLLIMVFVFSVLLTLHFSYRHSRDLVSLSHSVDRFVQSEFQDAGDDLSAESSSEETGQLIDNFRVLKTELTTLVEHLHNEKAKAQEASKAKSMFLANMSHEIRTPLNGVLGMTQVLQRMTPTSEQRECLDVINFSGENLLRLINDILDYSKIEAGQMQLENASFHLRHDVKRVGMMFEQKAAAKGLEFSVNVDSNIPDTVMGDSLRLQQVLINLVNNALKFTEEGSVVLNMEALDIDVHRAKVRISVQDTGIGMTEEQATTLFEAFQQADSSTTRKNGGTGLGLAICNTLVEMMGGEMQVKSSLGNGARFWFDVSFQRDATPVLDPTEVIPVKPSQIAQLHVLLAEDNEVNQTVIRMMLEARGHTVEIAENGNVAFEKWLAGAFDLVFMDIQMPVLNGYEATRKICQHSRYEVEQTPIVALTANAFKEDRDLAHQAGMHDFLTKPVNQNELDRVLRRYGRQEKSRAV